MPARAVERARGHKRRASPQVPSTLGVELADEAIRLAQLPMASGRTVAEIVRTDVPV